MLIPTPRGVVATMEEKQRRRMHLTATPRVDHLELGADSVYGVSLAGHRSPLAAEEMPETNRRHLGNAAVRETSRA
jgi:hypothetical protein